ncbi:hypothetical protein KIW84_023181 [Lathyrus oleraceus]|uniref:Uncharacterized protein n=1 Tax=Pisum sativum TaxID=3888 RepID=A0A9D4YCB2_PEA|nr:hypothetical protein KIW84_023181 [Pisum sativum]
MPTSIINNLDLGPLQHTSLTIQLENRSDAHPIGVVEDMLVQVNDLIFLADFYIMDYGETNSSRPLFILGRPFMKTSKIKFDVDDGTRAGVGTVICFNLYAIPLLALRENFFDYVLPEFQVRHIQLARRDR